MYDLWVKNATIVTLDTPGSIHYNGCLGTRADRIAYIGPAPRRPVRAKTVMDANENYVLPGLINSHTHAAMVYFRGFADDLPLKEWLEKHIWPLEARAVNPEMVRDAVPLAAAEMIAGGTTSFVDMYFFQDHAAEVLKEIGIRAFLSESVIDYPTPAVKTPKQGLALAAKFIEKWRGDSLIHPIVAPHAPYSCSDDLLRECRKQADAYRVPMTTHLAEEMWEHDHFVRYKGKTSVRHLADLGFWGPGVSAAHANWLDDDDIRILKSSGAGVAHNPRSNLKLATGFCRLPDLLVAGVPVGLGPDGAASNNELDMFGEFRAAALLHKGLRKDPTALPAETALRLATNGGARILSLYATGDERLLKGGHNFLPPGGGGAGGGHAISPSPTGGRGDAKRHPKSLEGPRSSGEGGISNPAFDSSELGSLEVGKKADFIIVNQHAPHLQPAYHPYSALVYSAKSSDVLTTVVNGRVLYHDRLFKTLDIEKVLRAARRFSSSLTHPEKK
ncbi:MAG: amidohydrolase [bacterium]